MIRVAVFSHLFPSEQSPASGTFIKNELDLLSEHVNIDLYVPVPLYRNIKSLEIKRYNVICLKYVKLPGKYYPKVSGYFLYKRLKSINLGKYDVCHAHFAFPSGMLGLYWNNPSVLTIHGSDWYTFKNNNYSVIDEVLDGFDKIIVVSDSLKEDIVKYYKSYENKINVIKHGVDHNVFNYTQDKISARPSFLTVANLNYEKGVDVLIKSISDSSLLRNYDFNIIYASKDKREEQKIYEIIKEYNLSNINIIGQVNNDKIVDYYNDNNIYVQPSRTEGFGISIIEAMACGLPVVATDSGGPKEIINDDRYGILSEPDNTEELRKGLEYMALNYQKYDRQEIRKRSFDYSNNEKIKKILNLYNEAVNG